MLMLPFLMFFLACNGGGSRDSASITYSVTFEENEGDTSIADITELHAGETLPAPAVIEKPGNLFDGWYSTSDFQDGSRWVFGDGGTGVTGDTTLYAKWMPCSPESSFTFSETATEAVVTGLTIEGGALAHVVIPLVYNGKPVTGINSNVIYGNSTITKISLGKSVTAITKPQFSECDNLTDIYVVEENEYLKDVEGVLYDEDMTTLIAYPPGKTDTSFTTPESVNTVGAWSFLDAGNLETIIVGDNVTSIGEYAFRECSSLTGITLPAGLSQLNQGLFVNCAKLSSVTIPSSVTVLSSHLFNGCALLTNVTIPGLVTTLGDYCFAYSGLTGIDIPASVTDIGEGVFASNSSLLSINVDAANPSYSSSSGILFNKAGTELILYPGGIAETSYAVPSGVTDIAANAFYGNATLTDITFNVGLEYIGNLSFYECTSLSSITLPSTLASMGYRVFEGCSSLATVVMERDEPPIIIGTRVFFGTNASLKIYVPTASVTDYREAANWITYESIIFDVATMP